MRHLRLLLLLPLLAACQGPAQGGTSSSASWSSESSETSVTSSSSDSSVTTSSPEATSEESSEQTSESPSTESVSSEDPSSEPSSESSSGETEALTLTLNGGNGRISGSYNTQEETFSAKASDGSVIRFAYLNLMYDTLNRDNGFAQFKKGVSYLYNLDPLGTIDIVSASYEQGKLAVSFSDSLSGTYTNPTTLDEAIELQEEYSYVRFEAPSSAAMVGSLSICFHTGDGPKPIYTSSDEPSSSEESSQTSHSEPKGEREEVEWNMNLDTFGSTFQVSLASKINATRAKTADYTDCLSIGGKAAAYPYADSKTFIPFYHEPKDSEKTNLSACNREHTWPNSRGSGKAGMGADPIMIRPTLTKDNSDRGNNFYGIEKSNEWDPASCGYEKARGEAARIILYCATSYYASGFSLSNNPGDSTKEKTMGTLKTLLEWNRDYPPTDFERLVNERYYQMGYARNAFVDHPEYADYIYDQNGIRTTPFVA